MRPDTSESITKLIQRIEKKKVLPGALNMNNDKSEARYLKGKEVEKVDRWEDKFKIND